MALVDLNDQLIAQVRQSADIVEFVNQVTPLKLAGKSYKGICPFHREKTPSFHVDRGKGLFYCFGCGVGGDVFKFLTLTERFTFPEAVEHVAARVGIELPKRRKTSQRDSDKDDLLELLDEVSEAFHQALNWGDNAAQAYLRKREVSSEVVQKYGFGYAPDSWDYVLRRFGQKHGEAKLEKAGLITPRKEGKTGYYDRFRNRLMIPIHSETGALVGFGGRSLDNSEPKYLNSPESEIFNKSRLLYNLHRSKDAMRRVDRAILVEGYFDAIAIDHAGVPGVVASMGTSLTSGQASLLRRFTRRVVIAYDGDEAGRNATLRAAPVLLAAGLDIFALDLGGEKDPDSLIVKYGADKFLEVLSNASDIFTFALKQWGADAANLSGREKADRIEQFVPLLSAVSDPVVRNDAAQRIADAFALEFSSVWARLRGKAQPSSAERQVGAPIQRPEKLVLAAAVQGKLSEGQFSLLREEYFGEEPVCRNLFSVVKNRLVTGVPIDFTEVETDLKGEAERTLFSELTFMDIDEAALQRIDESLRPAESNYIEQRILHLNREVSEAERQGDATRVDELVAQILKLSRMSSELK